MQDQVTKQADRPDTAYWGSGGATQSDKKVLLPLVLAFSGIPEIKSYLNGIDLPDILRGRTLVTKVVGIIFAQASGLPLGGCWGRRSKGWRSRQGRTQPDQQWQGVGQELIPGRWTGFRLR